MIDPAGKGQKIPNGSRDLKIVPCPFERMEETFDSARDVVCFSHLRWDFVYQRPQHLMSRFAREGRVFFVEEPVFGEAREPALSMRSDKSGVCVAVPQLPANTPESDTLSIQRHLLHRMYTDCGIRDCIAWYYSPMARAFTNDFPAAAIVYDCMDELSLFRGAPAGLRNHELELLNAADVVFTGGFSLYEAKKAFHHNVQPMPSSIDVEHFKSARAFDTEMEDKAEIPHPRLGFAGVIDERMDVGLVAEVAAAHPDWHLVFIGPVVKIDPANLPRLSNIHYLGQKPYEDLPSYIAGWDVALMPFAKNEATRYISPTKTPEYLASGKRVVSTSILDVVRTYEPLGLVRIADTPETFAAAIDLSLREAAKGQPEWLKKVDAFLAGTSWDRTWTSMMALIDEAISLREIAAGHTEAS